MACAECPENTRMETCPECKRLFCADVDHKICNECKGGYRFKDGQIYVMNQERFAKQTDFKVKQSI